MCYAHLVLYAYKLVSTRHGLEKIYATSHHLGQQWVTASRPPGPHRLLLFLLCWWRCHTVPRP